MKYRMLRIDYKVVYTIKIIKFKIADVFDLFCWSLYKNYRWLQTTQRTKI